MEIEIIVALITIVGGLGCTGLGIWFSRETKKIAAMQRTIERYRQEIRARQAVEDVACQWLVELGVSNTPRAAMLILRKRTKEEHKLRPAMSPRDLNVV